MRISDPDHPKADELRQLFEGLRGAAVSSFAEAEFAMGDLIGAMEASNCEPRVTYSQKVEKRLESFKNICLFHAGDDHIRDRVTYVVHGFEAVIKDRNALVHGAAKLFPDKRHVEVMKLNPVKGSQHNVVTYIFDLDLMEERVREFDFLCRNIIALSWVLADILGLQNNMESGFLIVLENSD